MNDPAATCRVIHLIEGRSMGEDKVINQMAKVEARLDTLTEKVGDNQIKKTSL